MADNNSDNRDPCPKRRRDKDNPYEIYSVGIDTDEPHYYLSFTDGQGVKICMEIENSLFNLFNQAELEDLSFLNEYDRHYEQSELTEATLERHMTKRQESVEEMVLKRLHYEELHRAIGLLSTVQQRRLLLHFFSGLSYKQISEIEGCSVQAVGKSITTALKKLRIFLKKG